MPRSGGNACASAPCRTGEFGTVVFACSACGHRHHKVEVEIPFKSIWTENEPPASNGGLT